MNPETKSVWASKQVWGNIAIGVGGVLAGVGMLPSDVIPTEWSVPAVTLAAMNIVLRIMSWKKLRF